MRLRPSPRLGVPFTEFLLLASAGLSSSPSLQLSPSPAILPSLSYHPSSTCVFPLFRWHYPSSPRQHLPFCKQTLSATRRYFIIARSLGGFFLTMTKPPFLRLHDAGFPPLGLWYMVAGLFTETPDIPRHASQHSEPLPTVRTPYKYLSSPSSLVVQRVQTLQRASRKRLKDDEEVVSVCLADRGVAQVPGLAKGELNDRLEVMNLRKIPLSCFPHPPNRRPLPPLILLRHTSSPFRPPSTPSTATIATTTAGSVGGL